MGMQLQLSHKAQPFFERYIQLCEDIGPQPAYHNLPDSFLLQRGLPKMDDSARRISRWRHRAHSPRALFDAHTELCAIKAETDRAGALIHAKKAFGCAAEDVAKADELDQLAEALEKKIKEGGKEVDEVINRVDTTAAPPEEEELGEEEMPPLGDDAEE